MSSSIRYRIVRLTTRGLLNLTGKDCFPYVQSIITNDLRVPSNVIYGSFLNATGSILLDLMVYKLSGNPGERQLMLNATGYKRYGIDGRPEDSLLIECDSELLEPARKTLFAYKIRREVTISHASDYDLFAIYPDLDDIHTVNQSILPNFSEIFSKDLIVVRDPRVGNLSYRIASRLGCSTIEAIKSLLGHHIPYPLVESSLNDYQVFRYKLGMAEGVDDYKPGNFHPIKANIDYMNGLSLLKGQFTGKEFAVRGKLRQSKTYRIMPIELHLPDGGQAEDLKKLNLCPGTRITSLNQQTLIGTMVNRKGRYGLALLKYAKCYENQFQLHHLESGLNATTWFPNWWSQPLAPRYLYGYDEEQKSFQTNSSRKIDDQL